MKTWTRSILKVGGGLTSVQVYRPGSVTSQSTLPLKSPETLLPEESKSVRLPRQKAQDCKLHKAHVFFVWKLYVSKRTQAKETLKAEFADMKSAIAKLTTNAQILTTKIMRKRTFHAWRRIVKPKKRSFLVYVVLRKFIIRWSKRIVFEKEKRRKIMQFRVRRLHQAKKVSFAALERCKIDRKRVKMVLRKWLITRRVSMGFEMMRTGVVWKISYGQLCARNKIHHDCESKRRVWDAWKARFFSISTGGKMIFQLLKKRSKTNIRLAQQRWRRKVLQVALLSKLVKSLVRKSARSVFFLFRRKTLYLHLSNLKAKLNVLPIEVEENFASALETRLNAMKSDFETERNRFFTQREALIIRHSALKNALSTHASRIYEELRSQKDEF